MWFNRYLLNDDAGLVNKENLLTTAKIGKKKNKSITAAIC